MRATLASDARYDELGTQRKVEGPEMIVELFKGWKTAFPDAVGTVSSAVASGNKAALEITWKGTHTGPLESAEGTIPASGKRQETPAACFFTFEGDKIKESRHYFDSTTLLKQIGANGAPTRAIGASSSSNAAACTWAAISAPKPPCATASCATTRRCVRDRDSAIVSRSNGTSVRGSTTSTSIPWAASSSAAASDS